VLVAATGSMTASLVVAATFAAAAAAVTGISFEQAADARGGVTGDSSRVPLGEVPRVLRRYPGAAVLIGDFSAQVLVRGVLVTLIVVASLELLDMGDTGVGLLNAAIGLGGLVGALAALGLGGGKRLGVVFVASLACWGLPLILVGLWPVAALALAAFFVVGISNSVLDISGFTLVQREVRNEDRVTAFGVMEGLFGVSALVGSLLAPALIAVLGGRGTFIAAGALLPVLALATWRPIARGAASTARTAERLALLRQNPLFAPLPLTALDRLAESMTPRSFARGEVLMRKGEPGEHYLLIADGKVDVCDDDGRTLRVCEPGDGVGEIALLRRVPRTATVTSTTAVQCYAIEAEAFLAAVAGPSAAAAAEAMVSARLLGEADRVEPAVGSQS
jgi:Cyclic nucleotide-binding domain/Major Facilitator Superfamily